MHVYLYGKKKPLYRAWFVSHQNEYTKQTLFA